MKLLIYKVNNRKKYEKEGMGAGFSSRPVTVERVLFLSFIVAFSMLVVVQTILVSPAGKNIITRYNDFEGTQLKDEEFLYKEGEIGLELKSNTSNNNLKVLVNGDEVAAFTSKVLSIKVKDGDIVEIDGSNIDEDEEVAITYKSDNISSAFFNEKVKITSGIERITQIRIK